MKDHIKSILFQDLPKKYQSMKEDIKNSVIKNLYSLFHFKYLYVENLDSKISHINFKEELFELLNKYKFITLQIKENFEKLEDGNPTKNIVICIENQCLVIESINTFLILDVLKKIKSSIICNDNGKMDSEIFYETSSFINKYKKDINNNIFVKNTIQSIITYIIRRNFYPSNFFKDPSFFTFSPNMKKVDDKNQYYDFQKNDFIDLRLISSAEGKLFYLVLHIETFFLFIKKKVSLNDWKTSQFISREVNFCKKYSHRCINHFYGIFQEDIGTISIIYEFMCNGTLESFLQNHQEPIDFFYSFMTMVRLFQAISYLHSNELIHRDIKPMNILLDHNKLPYLSDFETIRSINEDEINQTLTFDIGSSLYAPPEQIESYSYDISYPADVFDFGEVVYFLFEKRVMFSNHNLDDRIRDIKNNSFPQMKSTPESIQYLINKCVQYNPKDRIKCKEIEHVIEEQIKSFFYFEPSFIIERLKYIKKENLDHFFRECIDFIHDESNKQLTSFFASFIKEKDVAGVIKTIGKYYEEGTVFKIDFNKSKLLLEKAIEFGNSDAFNLLAIHYSNGLGVSQDYQKAIELFQFSINKNDSNGFLHMGNMYLNGFGVEKNFQIAKELYEKSAGMGNSGALNYLGVMYLNGKGVQRDYQKAREYFEKSANLGNSNALNFLGNIYLNGYGVKKDFIKSKKYFELALEKGNHYACIYIGNLYLKGYGVKKDYQKAIHYFELAAKQNNPNAFVCLGLLYLLGLGVLRDSQKAKKYFESSAYQNNSLAYIYLGNLYFYGFGVERDYNRAKEYYKLSAEKGNPKAYEKLGKLYYDNFGDVKDFDKAKKYFELSVENGNSNALIFLGDLFLDKKDIVKAIEYYELAAKEQNDNAFISLGKLYLEGIYVEIDYNKAMIYFQNATVKNNPDAFYYLGKIYYDGLGVKSDFQKAKKYFESSIQYDGFKAFFYLGLIYENGQGVDANKHMAIEYYKKCAQNNEEILISFNSNYWDEKVQKNENYYLSYNNLSLIYIIDFNEIDLGVSYLKEAAFSELPYGQNNYGLVLQFFSNKINKAMHMYERAYEQKFSIAEFIVGYKKELEKEFNDSIDHYLKAIQYECEPLKSWINIFIFDKRLDLSKIFIIFLTNLKLTLHHIMQRNLKESKKFFVNSIFRPIFHLLFENSNDSFCFNFEIISNQDNSIKTNLKNFIFYFPLFDIKNLVKTKLNFDWIEYKDQEEKTILIDFRFKKKINYLNKHKASEKGNSYITSENSSIFLFDEIKNIIQYYNKYYKFKTIEHKTKNGYNEIKFELNSDKIKRKIMFPDEINSFDFYELKNDIKNLINQIEKILFRPPFEILFGRIPINNQKCKQIKSINAIFYDGFEK